MSIEFRGVQILIRTVSADPRGVSNRFGSRSIDGVNPHLPVVRSGLGCVKRAQGRINRVAACVNPYPGGGSQAVAAGRRPEGHDNGPAAGGNRDVARDNAGAGSRQEGGGT